MSSRDGQPGIGSRQDPRIGRNRPGLRTARRTGDSGLVEGVREIGQEVVDALDPDGQPDERRIDLER